MVSIFHRILELPRIININPTMSPNNPMIEPSAIKYSIEFSMPSTYSDNSMHNILIKLFKKKEKGMNPTSFFFIYIHYLNISWK